MNKNNRLHKIIFSFDHSTPLERLAILPYKKSIPPILVKCQSERVFFGLEKPGKRLLFGVNLSTIKPMQSWTLIFDFDGTIADTHRYIVEISNRLSEEFRYNPIAPEEIDALKDKTSREIISHLQVPIFKIPAILARAKKELAAGITSIQPVRGLKEILLQLKTLEIRMGILSSNAHSNIVKFLQNHGLDCFDFCHSTSSVWSKNLSLQRLIDRYTIDKDQILYIGDETRDITAAKKLGIKVAAVTWGYNSFRVLKASDPDYLLHTPRDLLALITGQTSEPA